MKYERHCRHENQTLDWQLASVHTLEVLANL